MNEVPAIEVHDLTVSYQQRPVVVGVDFSVPNGKIGAVVGPNGAGKSSLLKAIVGLVPLTSGYTRLCGKPLEEARALLAYVPQREQVDWEFPITVSEVVLMGRYGRLHFFSRPSARDREVATRALAAVGMKEFAGRQISELSGGQQQRVFIARALAQEAQVYLMDEPFSGVDVATERTILDLFAVLRREGKTVLCVHHDLATVREHFDYCALLNLRLVAAGPTESVLTSDNLERAYGARLGLLSEVGEQLRRAPYEREQM
jgi:manganese/zinc/iron transport system ATP- binding protein